MDFTHPIEAVIPGAQGRILAVLAETTAELNLRTIADLSGVSVAQASRVMPGLVELGVVERREAPPSSLFRLVPEHVAAAAVLSLGRSRDTVIEEMGRAASELPVVPLSVIVFGSFARGDADPESDIDVVMVRPAGVDEANDGWGSSVEQWKSELRQLTGNRVEVLEVGSDEIGSRLQGRQAVWRDIDRDGLVVHGAGFDTLKAKRSA